MGGSEWWLKRRSLMLHGTEARGFYNEDKGGKRGGNNEREGERLRKEEYYCLQCTVL